MKLNLNKMTWRITAVTLEFCAANTEWGAALVQFLLLHPAYGSR